MRTFVKRLCEHCKFLFIEESNSQNVQRTVRRVNGRAAPLKSLHCCLYRYWKFLVFLCIDSAAAISFARVSIAVSVVSFEIGGCIEEQHSAASTCLKLSPVI